MPLTVCVDLHHLQFLHTLGDSTGDDLGTEQNRSMGKGRERSRGCWDWIGV